MAIEKLFLVLTTLVILTAIPGSCAPQLWNLGWPSQQESIPRLPAKAFKPAEVVPNRPLSFMPNPFSPPAPTVAASPQRQVPVALQPPKLEKQDIAFESRLHSGPTTPVSKPQARLDEAVLTTPANPVSVDTTTELSQPIDAVKTTALPRVVITTIPPPTAANPATEYFSEQNLREFIPAGVAALGAALGRDGCYLKAACLAGRLVPASLQGQGMMLLAAESLVPVQWKEVFRAAKSSMMDRHSQDCSSFACF